MNNFEVITLLTILRDEMKHQEDSEILQNTIVDIIERNIPAVKKKHFIFS